MRELACLFTDTLLGMYTVYICTSPHKVRDAWLKNFILGDPTLRFVARGAGRSASLLLPRLVHREAVSFPCKPVESLVQSQKECVLEVFQRSQSPAI